MFSHVLGFLPIYFNEKIGLIIAPIWGLLATRLFSASIRDFERVSSDHDSRNSLSDVNTFQSENVSLVIRLIMFRSSENTAYVVCFHRKELFLLSENITIIFMSEERNVSQLLDYEQSLFCSKIRG